MEGPAIYTTGEFAKKASVSIRTIRFYDKQGLLKPSHISDSGYRLYTDADFAKLQKILTLKYLGFSLDEIMDITVNDNDHDYVRSSLQLQLQLVKKKIDGLRVVEQALIETERLYAKQVRVDWNQMLHLIHMIHMEKSLVEQYKNSSNLYVRSNLHERFASSKKLWFPWIFDQMKLSGDETILELGCGNGELWRANMDQLTKERLILSDISTGMVQDARANLRDIKVDCTFMTFDFHEIPLADESVDVVVANHALFYAKDLEKVLKEIERVLKPNGTFFGTTYSANHMKEISQMVKEFDERIVLSEVILYDIFGLENGREILQSRFADVTCTMYEDELKVTEAQPLLDYIMSCHGNQHEYLNDQYAEFKSFVEKKLKKKGYLRITKQAGLFRCKKTVTA